jgi:hypothetical protein
MLKNFAMATLASAFIFTAAKADEEATGNLLKNGNFSIINSKGLPVGWQTSQAAAKQEFTEDKADKPEGCASSLKIEIKNTHKWLGYISQYVKYITPETEYVISGKIKSTAKGVALIQIKLIKEKKELKRINLISPTLDWSEVKKELSSGEADTIVVLCRFKQTEKNIGQTVWFSDIKLEKKIK